jgi:hypothetical protein
MRGFGDRLLVTGLCWLALAPHADAVQCGGRNSVCKGPSQHPSIMTTTTPWPDADASRRWHCGLLHLPLTLGFGGSHKLVASSAPVNGDKEMKGPYALSRRAAQAALTRPSSALPIMRRRITCGWISLPADRDDVPPWMMDQGWPWP